jgi:hypothetical protein
MIKNRLVYKFDNEMIEIIQCKTHYGDKWLNTKAADSINCLFK